MSSNTVLSVNQTAGAGITVSSPTGNVVVTANISRVQVQSSTLGIGIGSNTASYASLTTSSQVLQIDIPNNLYNIGNITLTGNLSSNNVTVSNTLNALGNITANYFYGNGNNISNIDGLNIIGADGNASNVLYGNGVFASGGGGGGGVANSITVTSAGVNSQKFYPMMGNATSGDLAPSANSLFYYDLAPGGGGTLGVNQGIVMGTSVNTLSYGYWTAYNSSAGSGNPYYMTWNNILQSWQHYSSGNNPIMFNVAGQTSLKLGSAEVNMYANLNVITGGEGKGVIHANGVIANYFTGDGSNLSNVPITWTTAPISNTASGAEGQVAYDAAGNLYVCVATNAWSKILGSTSW